MALRELLQVILHATSSALLRNQCMPRGSEVVLAIVVPTPVLLLHLQARRVGSREECIGKRRDGASRSGLEISKQRRPVINPDMILRSYQRMGIADQPFRYMQRISCRQRVVVTGGCAKPNKLRAICTMPSARTLRGPGQLFVELLHARKFNHFGKGIACRLSFSTYQEQQDTEQDKVCTHQLHCDSQCYVFCLALDEGSGVHLMESNMPAPSGTFIQ